MDRKCMVYDGDRMRFLNLKNGIDATNMSDFGISKTGVFTVFPGGCAPQ
jgi:hypothetical protein